MGPPEECGEKWAKCHLTRSQMFTHFTAHWSVDQTKWITSSMTVKTIEPTRLHLTTMPPTKDSWRPCWSGTWKKRGASKRTKRTRLFQRINYNAPNDTMFHQIPSIWAVRSLRSP